MQGAVRTAERRNYRKEQRDLSKEGIAADIRVPYTSGGESALGAASAARQLAAALLQKPEEVPYVRSRLDMEMVLDPEMKTVLNAIFRCVDEQLPLNLTTLQQMLDDKAFGQIALAQAQNHGTPLQRQDTVSYTHLDVYKRQVFDLLLGDNLQGRKEHIAEHGSEYLDDLDVSLSLIHIWHDPPEIWPHPAGQQYVGPDRRQLRGRVQRGQGGPHRSGQGAGKRGRPQRHHGQRHCAGRH